jgi:nicotinamidase-related amidase
MSVAAYDSATTGLIISDPYNDFLSEGGKLWPGIKDVAESVDLHTHLRELMSAARAANIQILFSHHRRWRKGDYVGWEHPTPFQLGTGQNETFAAGTWGGDWHPDFVPQPEDIVVHEHWAQSGFANTDLNYQLQQHGVEKIIIIGVVANTCVESTARFGMELGYHVTLVTDATAAFSHEAMNAAHEINGPSYAHNIVTTADMLALLNDGQLG